MSSTTTITETCGCGATFRVTAWAPHASSAARDWRGGHRHAESVGICGHRAPLVIPEGSEVAPMFCDLKAGHEGAHSGGECHWHKGDE